jgi:hypothetical protein
MARSDARDVSTVDWDSEHLIFRTIWQAAHTLQDTDPIDRSRRFPSRMGALVLVHAAYEGFINEALERLYPDIWQQEKTFFRTGRFQGLLGKTQYLAEQLQLSLDRAQRPYRTVAELNAWRNDLVHSRSVRDSGVTRADAYAKRAADPQPAVLAKLRPAFVARCFEDAAGLADILLAAAHPQPRRELSHLGSMAFWGPASSGGAALRRGTAG